MIINSKILFYLIAIVILSIFALTELTILTNFYLLRFGENKRHQRKIRTVCSMIGEVFEDFILRVLCVAAVVSTTLGIIKDGWAHGFQEGAGICIAIVIIVLVTVINDYAKEKQFQDLMAKSDVLSTKVRRNGDWT